MAGVVYGCCIVCVTGGSGCLASSLIKRLLLNGHTVHATLRNLSNEESKVGMLKSLPNAATHLVLFEADIYEPHQFEAPIRGSHVVFHIATPLHHTHGSRYLNSTEASVTAANTIAKFCMQSGSVRRLIYTASAVSMSPMKDDGSGFKDFIDETCWTPLHLSYPFSNPTFEAYINCKTATEKALLGFGESEESGGLEVVSLACGLIVGDILGHTSAAVPVTATVTFSQFTDQTGAFHALRFLEELAGKVPIVHIDDVCDAHIFCMEQSSIHGRFLCATSFFSSSDIANYYRLHHPQFQQKQGNCEEVPIRNIKMNSKKLIERGFIYKYDGYMILEDAFNCCNNKEIFLNTPKFSLISP